MSRDVDPPGPTVRRVRPAVRDELASGVPASTVAALLAAMNRLLDVRFKQRHALRTAGQALAFVGRED